MASIKHKKVCEFVTYMLDFYGTGTDLYDINATEVEVLKALCVHLMDAPWKFAGDTIDRERVRDVLLANRG